MIAARHLSGGTNAGNAKPRVQPERSSDKTPVADFETRSSSCRFGSCEFETVESSDFTVIQLIRLISWIRHCLIGSAPEEMRRFSFDNLWFTNGHEADGTRVWLPVSVQQTITVRGTCSLFTSEWLIRTSNLEEILFKRFVMSARLIQSLRMTTSSPHEDYLRRQSKWRFHWPNADLQATVLSLHFRAPINGG